jgi:hypothetical protein
MQAMNYIRNQVDSQIRPSASGNPLLRLAIASFLPRQRMALFGGLDLS